MGGAKQDVTGMGNAQNKDPSAAKVGAVRRGLGVVGKGAASVGGGAAWVWRKASFKDRRERRKERKEDAQVDKLADKLKERLGQGQQTQGTTQANEHALQGDDDKIEGRPLEIINEELRLAIVDGHMRPPKQEASEMDFIDVLHDKQFLDVLRTGKVTVYVDQKRTETVDLLTPLEEADTTYADRDLKERRRKLADGLERKDQLPPITKHELDLIYVTALGYVLLNRKEKGSPEEKVKVGCHKIWNPHNWAPNKPTPYEAFLRFVEDTAYAKPEYAKKEGGKGEFIGYVIKALGAKKSLADPDAKMSRARSLVDRDVFTNYVEDLSSDPFNKTANEFERLVSEVLVTPTSELHPQLEEPGLGMREISQTMLNEKKVNVLQAADRVKRGRAAEGHAQQEFVNAVEAEFRKMQEELEAARKVMETGQARLQKADLKRKELTQEGKLTEDNERQIAEFEKKAQALVDQGSQKMRECGKAIVQKRDALQQGRLDEFGDDVKDKAAELEQAKNATASLVTDHARVLGEHKELEQEKLEVDTIKRRLVSIFKRRLKEQMDGSKIVAIAEEMEGENHAVTDILNEARTLLEERGKLAMLTSPELKKATVEIGRLLDERERLAKLTQVDDGETRFAEQLEGYRTKVSETRQALRDNGALAQSSKDSLDEVMKVLEGLAAAKGLGIEPEKKDKDGNIIRLGVTRADLDANLKEAVLIDGMAEYEHLVARFEDKVGRAALPDKTKEQIKKLADALREGESSFNPDTAKSQIDNLRKAIAMPINKAAQLAVKRVEARSYRSIGRLSQADIIILRNIWIKQDKKIEDIPRKQKGFIKRSLNWMRHKLLSGRVWKDRGSRAWNWTAEFRGDLNPKNWFKKTSGWDPDTEEKYVTWIPRGLRGLLKLALLGYLGYGVYVAKTESPGLYDHFIRNYRWIQPWNWHEPVRHMRHPELIISDSYDVPEKLSDRGHQYYINKFGMGRRLGSEGEDSGQKRRLRWLEGNDDVLRFFQERRTLRRFVRGGKLPDNAAASNVTFDKNHNPVIKNTVPENCRNLGLKSLAEVGRYEPHEVNAGWERDGTEWKRVDWAPMRKTLSTDKQPGVVRCLYRIQTTPVRDGLKLNRSKADEFVAHLMSLERGSDKTKGIEITQDYLTENISTWVQKGWLITTAEERAMDDYLIEDRPNVDFATTHSERVSKLLAPITQLGSSREFLEEEHRDAFVSLWRAKIAEALRGYDPSTDELPENSVEDAFSKAAATAKSNRWIRDSSREYEEEQIRQSLAKTPASKASMDTLIAQRDIREAVLRFYKTESRYKIMETRFDEFVVILVKHKDARESLDDFDPTARPDAKRIRWAYTRKLLYMADGSDLQGVGDQTREAPAKATAADREAVSSFYSKSQSLDDVMFGIFQKLGDKAKGNEDAIRAEVRRVLTSDKGRDKTIRRDWGIEMDQQGNAKVTNSRKASAGIGVHVSTWLTARSSN